MLNLNEKSRRKCQQVSRQNVYNKKLVPSLKSILSQGLQRRLIRPYFLAAEVWIRICGPGPVVAKVVVWQSALTAGAGLAVLQRSLWNLTNIASAVTGPAKYSSPGPITLSSGR